MYEHFSVCEDKSLDSSCQLGYYQLGVADLEQNPDLITNTTMNQPDKFRGIVQNF